VPTVPPGVPGAPAGQSRIASIARAQWRTAAGAAVGALAGAAYARFIGCATGTCPLTSNVWTAALFFGLTGALVALPPPRRRAEERSPDA
jgi:hypothetical protein